MSDHSIDDAVKRAASLLAESDALVISAGAGMGVDSGLPDFRGSDGFWKAYPALARAGIEFHQIASPAAFEKSPTRAWGFYGHRLALYRRTRPHAGFALLKTWGKTRPQGYWVFTSNVDAHFQRAGFDPMRLHECHGSIHHLQCTQPCHDGVWPADSIEPAVDEDRCELTSAVPTCRRCGRVARPNIMLFNDWHWVDRRQQGQVDRQRDWLARVTAPVVIEIGAGTAIPTVRHFSHRIVRQHQGQVIRINPRESEVPHGYGIGLPMGALQALSAIDAALAAM